MKSKNTGAKQALVDFYLDPGNITLTESQDESVSRVIEGVASRGNVTNLNGRYYPTEVLSEACDRLQESVAEGSFLGELDHPVSNARGSLERAALKFTKLWMDGDELRYEAKVLNTEHGNKLLTLLQDEVKVGMSTRGVGSVKRESVGTGKPAAVIQSDFVLYGVDAVSVPSNPAGIAKLRESLEESMGIESFEDDAPERKEPTVMENVTELRAEYPELVEQVEAAAIQPVQAELDALKESNEALSAQLAEAQEIAAKYEALKVSILGEAAAAPETEGDDSLETAVSALSETVETLRAELAEAKAEAERVAFRAALDAQLAESFEAAVSGHKFEKTLRRAISDLSKFESVEALTAKVASTIEFAESVAGEVAGTPPSGKGVVESDSPITESFTATSEVERILELNAEYIRGLSRSYQG